MKKLFTSIVVMLAVCATAMAQQIPTKFNYQGVCAEKNAEITVKFTIAGEDGVVYFEEQKNVETNANGMFTTQIGTKADWEAIDWVKTDLTLETRINGKVVSTTPFTSVPYAKVAEKYVGQEYIENDVQDLVAGMRMKADVADVADLRQSVENGMENMMKLGEYVMGEDENSVVNNLERLNEAMEYVSSDVQGVQETLRGKANVEDVAAIENLAQSLSEDLYKEDGIVDAVVALQELGLANVVENLEMMTPMLQGMEENIETLQSTVEQITELVSEEGALGLAQEAITVLDRKVTALETATEDLEATTNLAQSVSEDLYKEGGIVETVVANQEAIEIVSSDLQGVVESLRGKANVDDVEAFKQDVENGMENMMKLGEYVMGEDENSVVNNLERLNEAMEYVSSDVQGVQETLRGKANVEDVAAIENLAQSLSEDLYKEDGIVDAVVALQELNLANVVENLDQMTPMLQSMEENIEALQSQVEILFSEEDGPVASLTAGFTQLNNVVSDQAETIDQLVYAVTGEDGPVAVLEQGFTQLNNVVSGQAETIDQLVYAVTGEDGPVAVLEQGFTQLNNVVSGQAETIDQVTEGLQTTQNDVTELVEANMNRKTEIVALQEENEALKTQITDLNRRITLLEKAVVGFAPARD